MLVERLDDPGEVAERAGQAIDLIDHHHVDRACRDVGERV